MSKRDLKHFPKSDLPGFAGGAFNDSEMLFNDFEMFVYDFEKLFNDFEMLLLMTSLMI